MNSPPTPEALREAAASIVAGPDYRLDQQQSHSRWLEEFLLTLIEWVIKPLRWLFDLTEGLPDFLRWLIVAGLTLVAIGLIYHMVYSLTSALRRPKSTSSFGVANRHRGLSAEEFEQLASDALIKGHHVTAIRYLFQASVTRIENSLKQKHRPGTTNRDLLRTFQKWPPISNSLKHFVDVIDRKWYGDEACTESDYAGCHVAYTEVCGFLRERGHVLRT